MNFNRYLIVESQNTENLETASCCGIFLTSEEYKLMSELAKTVPSDERLPEVFTILQDIIQRNGDKDWSTPNYDKLAKDLENPKKYDKTVLLARQFAGQAVSMKNFVDTLPFKVDNFIQNSMKEYYNIERDIWPDLKKIKENTADVIISNTSKENILNGLKSGKIDSDISTGVITLSDKWKIVQVSLKAGKQSNFGSTGKFLSNIGIEKKSPRKFKFQDEPIVTEEFLLHEGFFKNILGKITSFFKKTWKRFTGIFKKYDGIKVDSYKKFKGLNESDSFYSEIFKNLQAAQKAMLSTNIPFVYKGNIEKGQLDKDLVFLLKCNYISFDLIKDLVRETKSQPDILKDMIADGYFGGTNLPLWVVYGDVKMPPKYLKTKNTFEIEKSDVIEEKMAVVIKPSTPLANKEYSNKYYSVQFWILKNVDKNGNKTYINWAVKPTPSIGVLKTEFRSKTKTVSLNESIKKVL